MAETQNLNEIEETDFETSYESESFELAPQPDPEAELNDNSLDEVIRKFGGNIDDWDEIPFADSGMRFDSSKKEMLDSQGNSLTTMIKATCSAEQVAMHMNLLAGWESNSSKVQLIEYVTDGKLNVTAIKLENGGKLNSRTWTREVSEEAPILDIEAFGRYQEDLDEPDEETVIAESVEEIVEIDLNQYLEAEMMEKMVSVEDHLSNQDLGTESSSLAEARPSRPVGSIVGMQAEQVSIDIDSLEKGHVVVENFEPRSQGVATASLSDTNNEFLDDLVEIELKKAA